MDESSPIRAASLLRATDRSNFKTPREKALIQAQITFQQASVNRLSPSPSRTHMIKPKRRLFNSLNREVTKDLFDRKAKTRNITMQNSLQN